MTHAIHIEPDPDLAPEVEWTLRLLAHDRGLPLSFTPRADEAMIRIGPGPDAHLRVSQRFFADLRAGRYAQQHHFRHHPHILLENGADTIDHLATAFYMINGIQEYADVPLDGLGRFPYAQSYQHRFQVPHAALAGGHLDALARALGLPDAPKRPSRVLITHDIDEIHGAWTQDLWWALKHFRPGAVAAVLASIVLRRPAWADLDRIMDLHDEHGLKSLFLFIVHRGGNGAGLRNADYDIRSRAMQERMRRIRERDFGVGLHKSVSPTSMEEETQRLGVPAIANRYHYLKFRWPAAIDELEAGGLAVDTSLGFAEEYGFRNSYARPFVPFHLKERRPATFVEAPLHVMDRTFFGYRKDDGAEVARLIIDFFERNDQGTVFGLLWHNNFFSTMKFGAYLKAIRLVLAYLREKGIRSITAEEVRDTYLPTA
ncbi:MAG: hypothetical protein JST66_14265 [Bacteroidetes bacterium]|nr:hypothetical protein [Bacteroidota bacterium]